MNDPSKWYHAIHALPHFDPADLLGINFEVEGVVIIEPNGYCLKVLDRLNGRVKNVKCLAFRYSTDGANGSYGTRSTV